jgi:hypothetical protein
MNFSAYFDCFFEFFQLSAGGIHRLNKHRCPTYRNYVHVFECSELSEANFGQNGQTTNEMKRRGPRNRSINYSVELLTMLNEPVQETGAEQMDKHTECGFYHNTDNQTDKSHQI